MECIGVTLRKFPYPLSFQSTQMPYRFFQHRGKGSLPPRANGTGEQLWVQGQPRLVELLLRLLDLLSGWGQVPEANPSTSAQGKVFTLGPNSSPIHFRGSQANPKGSGFIPG